MNAGLRSLLVVLPALALVACETTKPPLPGERLSVLSLDKQLEPDPEIASLEIRLPRPVVNSGRLTTRPNAPSSLCWQSKMTVWQKF